MFWIVAVDSLSLHRDSFYHVKDFGFAANMPLKHSVTKVWRSLRSDSHHIILIFTVDSFLFAFLLCVRWLRRQICFMLQLPSTPTATEIPLKLHWNIIARFRPCYSWAAFITIAQCLQGWKVVTDMNTNGPISGIRIFHIRSDHILWF